MSVVRPRFLIKETTPITKRYANLSFFLVTKKRQWFLIFLAENPSFPYSTNKNGKNQLHVTEFYTKRPKNTIKINLTLILS